MRRSITSSPVTKPMQQCRSSLVNCQSVSTKANQSCLLDVRTREEWDAVKLPNSQLFTQELMQDILAKQSRTDLLVIYDHKGARSLDATAFFQGHGFENVKSLRGGIDAWSAEVDPTLPRYHLE